MAIADIIFIGGAIAQAVCHDVWSMVRPPFIPISVLDLCCSRSVVAFSSV